MTTPDLLVLRLDALELDITKVLAAVTDAKDRGQLLETGRSEVGSCLPRLRAVEGSLKKLTMALEDEPKIRQLLSANSLNLDQELDRSPEMIDEVIKSVKISLRNLGEAAETTVVLSEADGLQSSLKRRCDEVTDEIRKLRDGLEDRSKTRTEHWQQYRRLLNDTARPVFAEYVDFLGGLTIRDTGLDDRICEMTDALLGRFTALSQPPKLPLPARHAALGSALDSVVLIGFPEWSIWGVPLVCHEVGLRYAHDRNSEELVALIRHYSDPETPLPGASATPTEAYVQDLIADAFATYTMGFSYACAAMLLRLSPRADEVRDDLTKPRDIDRARVIMMIMRSGPPSAPAEGGSFVDAAVRLQKVWEYAVRNYVEPPEADDAAKEAAGPPTDQDWLDDFSRDAVKLFRNFPTIRPYNNERWFASELWRAALADQKSAPKSLPDDVVPDLLTAAWRIRLDQDTPVDHGLAADVKRLWSAVSGRVPRRKF
jgi:hypothetical protein